MILPGTHSKHVYLRRGVITSFVTLMTGELFAHLHAMPTLGPCLSRAEVGAGDPWFRRGVRDAAAGELLPSLFRVRARSLLDSVGGTANSAYLSGLIIGAELSHGESDGSPARRFLAAGDGLAALYLDAAQELSLPLEPIAPGLLEKAVVCAHRRFCRPDAWT